MTRVVVLGQPFWGQRIADVLTSANLDAVFVGSRGYARLLAVPPAREPDVLIRAGFRMGANTPRGRLFDAWWRLLRVRLRRSAACYYWLGTDVFNLLEDARAGHLRAAAVRAARDDLHLAVAPWLVEELETVGLHATLAGFPESHRVPDTLAPLPEAFSVLTYVPDARFAFYGGPIVLAAARRLPGVRFEIVGGTGEGVAAPPANVRWRGWVADMASVYDAATVVVRVPRHDGLGSTVVEGLMHARHVVYTYDVPFTTRVDPESPDALAAALDSLEGRHRRGELVLNTAGRDYAIEAFDQATLTARLRALVQALA
jgi:hypothetical protein